MPLGLWKSRWEIHREDWEAEARDLRGRSDELREECRDLRGHSDELREECRDLRATYDREVAEARVFNRELLIRLEKTYANLGLTLGTMGSTLGVMGEQVGLLAEQIIAMRKELHENTDATKAQTEAILRLVDRFEGTDGRPPV